MSLTATPVTATDLQNLQKGILRHTNPTEAAAEAALINAGATTVAAYETSLMAQAQAFTVDAEAVLEVFTGQTGTSAELDNLVNNFLPAQNAYAIAHGFNTTVFDAESLGLGLSAGTAFATNFGPANAALPNTVAGDALAAGSIANAVFGSCQYAKPGRRCHSMDCELEGALHPVRSAGQRPSDRRPDRSRSPRCCGWRRDWYCDRE